MKLHYLYALLISTSIICFIFLEELLNILFVDSQIPIVEEMVYQKSSSHKFWRQFFALHTKRFYHTVRNKKGLFGEVSV